MTLVCLDGNPLCSKAIFLCTIPAMERIKLAEGTRNSRTLFVLFACVAAVGAFLAYADLGSAHGNSGSGAIVHITDEGFEPRSVEVVAGETVVFENDGQEAHWPASDDHPMHTKYPDFDPLKPLEAETEWRSG